MSRLIRAILFLASLAMIGGGLWLVCPPAALITVGGIVWLDLLLGSLNEIKMEANKAALAMMASQKGRKP